MTFDADGVGVVDVGVVVVGSVIGTFCCRCNSVVVLFVCWLV